MSHKRSRVGKKVSNETHRQQSNNCNCLAINSCTATVSIDWTEEGVKLENGQKIDTKTEIMPNATPTLAELEQQLQEEWTKGIAEDFIELIHKKSKLDKIEATNFLAQLIEDGKMGYDPEGLLRWVR